MIFDVENDFWINVEDGFEGNSYWIPTPDDEIDEDEFIGIIELDVSLKPFERICSLAHEVGHYFLHVDKKFWMNSSSVIKESLAWYLGYEYFKAMGYKIDQEEYRREASKCVDAYVRSLSGKKDSGVIK